MTTAPGDPLARALDQAIAGRREALFDLLYRGSHLPGPRMNEPLADAFATACRTRGAKADAVVLMLARLTPVEAPGATSLEFLPVCGIYALGARAAFDDGAREALLAELHAHADDSRFRARDAVVHALARIGATAGATLAESVASWMDGYFHAAAVVRALATESWLGKLKEAKSAVLLLDAAFALARDAPRSAARWPGHKELLSALERGAPVLAAHFGVLAFDMLVRWAETPDPVLRELVERILGARKLAGRHAQEVARVRKSVEKARPAPRNPDHDVGPTRDRSRKRRRKG